MSSGPKIRDRQLAARWSEAAFKLISTRYTPTEEDRQLVAHEWLWECLREIAPEALAKLRDAHDDVDGHAGRILEDDYRCQIQVPQCVMSWAQEMGLDAPELLIRAAELREGWLEHPTAGARLRLLRFHAGYVGVTDWEARARLPLKDQRRLDSGLPVKKLPRGRKIEWEKVRTACECFVWVQVRDRQPMEVAREYGLHPSRISQYHREIARLVGVQPKPQYRGRKPGAGGKQNE